MKTNITISEAIKWVGKEMRELALGIVLTEEKVQILIQRRRAEVEAKYRAYHAALRAEVKVQNPEHPDEGSLPELREKLARRDARGAKAGQELKGQVSKARQKELKEIQAAASASMDQIEQEIEAQEALLANLQETTRIRRRSWETAAAKLTKLEQVAPSVIAQTAALKQAQKDKLEAAAAQAAGAESDDDQLLAELTADLEEAKAGATAAEIMVEDTPDEIDLDKLDKEEAQEEAASERISRWNS